MRKCVHDTENSDGRQTEGHPSRPMTLASVVTQCSRHQQLTDIIAHRNYSRISTGNFISFFQCCNCAVEICVRCTKDTTDDAVQEHIDLFVSTSEMNVINKYFEIYDYSRFISSLCDGRPQSSERMLHLPIRTIAQPNS